MPTRDNMPQSKLYTYRECLCRLKRTLKLSRKQASSLSLEVSAEKLATSLTFPAHGLHKLPPEGLIRGLQLGSVFEVNVVYNCMNRLRYLVVDALV